MKRKTFKSMRFIYAVTILLFLISTFPFTKVYADETIGTYYSPYGWYSYSEFDDHIEIRKFNEQSDPSIRVHETIPAYINDKPVTSIQGAAFSAECYVESVYIPDTVTQLGKRVFETCDNLASVRLSSNITELPYNTFANCPSLKQITNVSNNLTAIRGGCFTNCKNLVTFSIPPSVSVIEDYPYASSTWVDNHTDSQGFIIANNFLLSGNACTNDVEIPSGVHTIYHRAFYYNEDITSVLIPDSVTSIDYSAFEGCKRLEKIIIKNKICDIYESKYTFPQSATIYSYLYSTAEAYANNFSMKFEAIPDDENSDYKGNYEFSNEQFCFTLDCSNKTAILTSCLDTNSEIEIPSKLVGYTIPGIGKLDEYEVIGIADKAFQTKTSIVTIQIPDTIKTIGKSAFTNCTKLEKLELPKSIDSIGVNALIGCNKLKQVYIYNPYCSIDKLGISKYSDLVIYGYLDSTAEKYAAENDITFISLDEYLDTTDKTSGDVNNDGKFNITDIVLLQKWLLAVPDAELANWKAADLCEDRILNVFDLCMMKRELISK